MTTYIESTNSMKIILSESSYAFSILMENGGSTNTDFAEYTSSNFIRSIRQVMQKPDLSRAQLASMLRAVERRKRVRDNDDNWASFMASRMASYANSNGETTTH